MFDRYACVRQHDQSDCGAAALATIALHYGKALGLQQVRDIAGTDRVGTNLLGLIQGAQKLGFTAKAVKGPYEALRDVPLPAIAHWITEEGLGHFVVLHRVEKNRVVVADPGKGLRKLASEEFKKRWTGYLLLVTPDATVQVVGSPSSRTGPWRRFMGLLKPHASVLAEAFVCAVLLTVLGLSTSFFIQHLVDSVLVSGEWRLLNALAVGMVVVLLFRGVFGAMRHYLLVHVSRKVDLGLISTYARHVLGQPIRFFEMRRVGEILSRINDAVKVRQAVSGTTLMVMVDSVLVVVFLAVMYFYDWHLALVATIVMPVFLTSVWLHHPATRRLSREAMEAGAMLEAHLIEDATGVDTIKSFTAEDRRADEGEQRLVKLLKGVFSMQMINLSMGTIGTAITGLAGIAILWYGGHRVVDGAMTIGELMFFNSLLGMMLEPLGRLASVNLEIQDAVVAVDRFYEILDLEKEQLHEDRKAVFAGAKQEVRLQAVTFRYGCRAEVLKKVDLLIPAGKTVAIVGESGSGKTTLLKLLMRFYDPTEGRITIDGMDLRDFTLGSLRARIGLVSQEPYIFTGSIRDNIAFGKPGATMDEVVGAARAAKLDAFIDGLPQRYDTVIGERGANLSGGQRQRLAIARAVLMQPDILVFDEATSHLDSATERALKETLAGLLSGRTVILVAHRLSTVRDADAIYVLEGGQIVESGAHRELLDLGGRYAALWRAQTEEAPPPARGREHTGPPPALPGETRRYAA